MSQQKKWYCLLPDLKDYQQLINEYEQYHLSIWPEIEKSKTDAGISSMEIYRVGNSMSMMMEVDDRFLFEEKSTADKANEKVQEWELLMWKYQSALP